MFLDSRSGSIKSSRLNLEFYLFLLHRLNSEYDKTDISEYNGIPTREAVNAVYAYLKGLTKKSKLEAIQAALNAQNRIAIEKHIYNTYKAASYFVNMAKDKFGLIDVKNQLTETGKELLAIRSGFFSYSNTEKLFYFKRILSSDILIFLSLCYFLRLSTRYKLKDYVAYHFDFLDKFYAIRHFSFTSASLDNFDTVRKHWIDILEVMNSRGEIRSKYQNILTSDLQYRKWSEEITSKFSSYEKQNFKSSRNYLAQKLKLEKKYDELSKAGKADLGFVNLYDIKKGFRVSHEDFENLLSSYYEQEKRKKHIFFSNIVNSIDRRKRFIVRGTPVLKIKIK